MYVGFTKEPAGDSNEAKTDEVATNDKLEAKPEKNRFRTSPPVLEKSRKPKMAVHLFWGISSIESSTHPRSKNWKKGGMGIHAGA